MALIQSTAIPSGATGYEIDQSLRFEDSRSAYLSRTFVTPTNRKIWTFSVWFKGGNVSGSSERRIFSTATGAGGNTDNINYTTSGAIRFIADFGQLISTQVFRDPSSWYHLIYAYDSTQSTEANRLKMYVNGTQVTSFSTTAYPSLNQEIDFNSALVHDIGRNLPESAQYYDGYLAEVYWVDGQAKAPTDFGETGDYGEWKPIEYEGTYGTNGFYLPFKQDYTVEGFSTVVYPGAIPNGSTGTNYVGGVGFQPDLVWIKKKSSATNHCLTDSVRGANKRLASDTTNAEITDSNALMSFDTDGFTVGENSKTSRGGESYVAWNWDMGGSNASNTNGSITSTVRANPTYGQSIVSYNGTEANATVGHGLSSAPEMIITKSRGHASDWGVYHVGMGANKVMYLHSTSSPDTDTTVWQNTTPSSSVFSIGNTPYANADYDYIAYCFHSVTGYSKFGSYSGTGSSGNAITTGFKPAFVMVKNATTSGENWYMFDSTREPFGELDTALKADESNAEATSTTKKVEFTNTGFKLNSTNRALNHSDGDTYIYMAFADTREYAYWLDQSGNNNDWTSNNLTESDVMVDSPTNNFATMNPLWKNSFSVLSEGNLELLASGGSWGNFVGSLAVSSGKWYAEVAYTVAGSGSLIGIANTSFSPESTGAPVGTDAGGDSWGLQANGNKYNANVAVTYGSAYTTGDIVGIALDLDAGTLTFYKNNVSQGVAYSSLPADYYLIATSLASAMVHNVNFGQDSSFAGTKTAQGNQDGNSIGDFYYAPPTGFLALCTSNLPDVAVVPSENFNTVLYTGNATARNITGVGFQPDFVWVKNRSSGSDDHQLYDAVRTGGKLLKSNTTGAEITTTSGITGFVTDGFTSGTSGGTNANGGSIVSWNWKANGSGSSNTNGDITSTVSANVDAGFSIVTYTGNGSNIDVGHGLSKAPEIVMVKVRNDVGAWIMNLKNIPSQSAVVDMVGYLNTVSQIDGNNVGQLYFGSQAPTSSVFRVQNVNDVGGNGETLVAYCFHSVDGYSKIDSYTGNGNADGTFVYTGFKPAFVIIKNASG